MKLTRTVSFEITMNIPHQKLSFYFVFGEKFPFFDVTKTWKNLQYFRKTNKFFDLRMLHKQQNKNFFTKKTGFLKSQCYGTLFSTKNNKMEKLKFLSANVTDPPPNAKIFIDATISAFFYVFCQNLTSDEIERNFLS